MTITSPLSALRRSRKCQAVLLLAVGCTVGLYCVAATHHHRTQIAELHCPVCQVAVHNSLQVYAPQLAPVPPAIRLRFVRHNAVQVSPPETPWLAQYQPRAPPIS